MASALEHRNMVERAVAHAKILALDGVNPSIAVVSEVAICRGVRRRGKRESKKRARVLRSIFQGLGSYVLPRCKGLRQSVVTAVNLCLDLFGSDGTAQGNGT